MIRLMFLLVVLVFASCADDDAKPCVGCAPGDDAENNMSIDAGGDSGEARDDGVARPDSGGAVDVGSDVSVPDMSQPDVGDDMSQLDVGMDMSDDADMMLTCNADERLCDGVCATCPDATNVEAFACDAGGACVVATCDPGFEICSTGCCVPAGPAMSGGVSMQSFTALDTSIALDSNEYPQISYRNFFNTNVEHAAWDGREWVISVVDVGDSPALTSLAIDSMDVAHIAWFEPGDYDLRYARQTASGWQAVTVDSAGDVGVYPSIAVDDMDRPHIAYRDSTNGALKHARWTGSAWALETVDAGTGNTGWFSSIAIDSAGRPAIAYADFSIFAVRVARFNGTAWVTTTVETRPAVPQYISMDLDSADQAHISYLDNPAMDLRYVRRSSGTWVGELVDTTANYGHSSRLKVDVNDYPHIVYHDATTDDVRYTRFDGAAWQTQDLSLTESIGPQSSLAVDAAGGAHLSLSVKTAPVQLRYLKLP